MKTADIKEMQSVAVEMKALSEETAALIQELVQPTVGHTRAFARVPAPDRHTEAALPLLLLHLARGVHQDTSIFRIYFRQQLLKLSYQFEVLTFIPPKIVT